MKALQLLPALLLPLLIRAQDCPTYVQPSNQSVKIVMFTDTDQCFTLTVDGMTVNPSPSQHVTYTMPYGSTRAKMKLTNGLIFEKNVMVTNTAMATSVYELIYNDNKREYQLKSRPFQGEVTEETHQARKDAHDASIAEMKARQEASDKEWDEKRAADHARHQAEYNKEKDEIMNAGKSSTPAPASDPKPAPSPAAAAASPAASPASPSAAPSAGPGISKGTHPYDIQVLCKGQPVANTYVSIGHKDFSFGTCLTDEAGKCRLMASDKISCQVPIDLKGERNNAGGGAQSSTKWSVEGLYFVNCQGGTSFHLEKAAQAMSDMFGFPAEDILSGWGF